MPGFDQAADINKDNYLSDDEYQTGLIKTLARFRWESGIPLAVWNKKLIVGTHQLTKIIC